MTDDAAPPAAFAKIGADFAAEVWSAEGDDAAVRETFRPCGKQVAQVETAQAVADRVEWGVGGKVLNTRQMLGDAVMQGLLPGRISQRKTDKALPPQTRRQRHHHGSPHEQAVDEQNFGAGCSHNASGG